MQIVIRIIYMGYENKILRTGEFLVNPFEFEIDPDKEASQVAYNWLIQIRREAHIEEIISVDYNDKHNITELVQKLDK